MKENASYVSNKIVYSENILYIIRQHVTESKKDEDSVLDGFSRILFPHTMVNLQ